MSNILQAFGSAITAVIGWITSSISSVVGLFYDTTASTPTFTFLGTLLLIGFGVGMVWALIRFVRGLVRGA